MTKNTIGQFIIKRRKELGMNRAQLARVMWGKTLNASRTVSTNYSTLEAWEKFGVTPDANNRKMLAKALLVPDLVFDLEEHGIPYTLNPETKIVEVLFDA